MEQSEDMERELRPSSFFKVMINDFSEKMLIPIAFTVRSELLNNIAEYYFLSTHKGTWRVGVHVESEMKVYFTDGWSVFVAHHKLIAGEILVFEQLSNRSFFVYVYGHSGCGKDFDGCTKIGIKEELLDGFSDDPMTEEKIKSGTKIFELREVISSSECSFSAILNASNCDPKKPYMHIPISFVRSAHLDRIESILVEDASGKVWEFNLDRGTRYTNGSKRVKLQKNWREFAKANNLQVGQKYTFEFDRTHVKDDIPLLKFKTFC